MNNKKIGRNDPCSCGSGKKYKKCCMETNSKVKECFGDQGGSPLHGEAPVNCLNCDKDTFDRCHKVSLATSLQGISLDLSLISENGLKSGWLKCFKELSEAEDRKL
ncbi:MAG TPA: SEC-C metal-binding domain-containing protein [Bacteroidales bacterium]|nr:SEC-C metal-binding domain-containing protein [Bacteroidales bacterium]